MQKAFGLGFKNGYMFIPYVHTLKEHEYAINFKDFLFKPSCEFVAALLDIDMYVHEENSIGFTGLHTKATSNCRYISHTPRYCCILRIKTMEVFGCR